MEICGATYSDLNERTHSCLKPVGHKSLHGPADTPTRPCLKLHKSGEVCVLPLGHPETHHESGSRVWADEPVPSLSWAQGAIQELTARVRELDERLDRIFLGAQSNLYAAVEGLNKRLTALEERLSPPEAKQQETCTAQLRFSGTSYDCVLPPTHIGPHEDEDRDQWSIVQR